MTAIGDQRNIAFVAYPSDNVARTRRWYEETLGLRFAGPYVEDGVEKYNEAHLATGCFSLMASEWVGRAPGAGAGVVFAVDDIEDAMHMLREKGVSLDELFDGPTCRQVSFADPDGKQNQPARAQVVTPDKPIAPAGLTGRAYHIKRCAADVACGTVAPRS